MSQHIEPADRNIILVGFMGSGKTSIGSRLAQELRRDFIDTDREIEKRVGMKVSDIFKKYGETRFRSEETLVTADLAQHKGLVISTGGGWILKKENIDLVKSNSLIVWLTGSPEVIFERVMRKKHTRPLLKNIETPAQLAILIEKREALYASAADMVVDTGEYGIRQAVLNIANYLQQH